MRFRKLAVLAFAGLTIASPISTDIGFSTSAQGLEKRASYPSVSGLKFSIDGKVAYFAGSNSYWIGFLTNNADVDLVMTHLKSSGLKVLRVWGELPLFGVENCAQRR